MQKHVQLGELYLEFIRNSSAPDECDYCQKTEWQAPIMERIPCPFPDKTRESHYLDVFSTPTTNEDGSPREIDDFLPRARVKKVFATGNLHSSDQPKMAELSK